MLQDNINALKIILILISKKTNDTNHFTQDELQKAIRTLMVITSKTEKALSKLSSKTSQYKLLQNRLKSFHIAESFIKIELDTYAT